VPKLVKEVVMIGIVRRVVTVGKVMYGAGGALVVSGIAFLGADLRGPIVLIALGLLFVVAGTLCMIVYA